MDDHIISRRNLVGVGIGVVAGAGLLSVPGVKLAKAVEARNTGWRDYFPWGDHADRFAASFAKAYAFLDEMMDAYADGSTVRLAQSYSDQINLESTAFVYDNAVAIIAFLLRGGQGDIARARVLGDALLYAQAHDPNFTDGRVRQGYFADQPNSDGAYVKIAGDPFWFTGSSVGDTAWSGLALAHLFQRTHDAKYLGTANSGALGLANFIHANFFDERSDFGGYMYGFDNAWPPNLLTYKSTEHNVDVFALFKLLARLTGDRTWSDRAQYALKLVKALYNEDAGFFWTGTGADGISFGTDPGASNIPADVQTWTYLALQDPHFAPALDWCKTNLAVTDTPQAYNSSLTGKVRIAGISYASQALHPPIGEGVLAPSDAYSAPPNPSAVWLEGSAHLVAALLARGVAQRQDIDGFAGDFDTARDLLDNIRVAQDNLGKDQTTGGGQPFVGMGLTPKPISAGQGIQASTSYINTGFDYSYKPCLHIAATAWYVIAGLGGNPFQVGLGTSGR